ncbi:MAG: hypothetical protein D6748_06005 [Calditrichaeota bacterium]|nr:MAG: hypothetical protein D6748_06005 [Calditrichota bacterium]
MTPAVEEKPHVKNVPPVLEEPQVQQVLARVKKVRDEENGITWYYNKNISHYVFKNSLEAYVGESDAGDVWLRLRIYYNGEKMLEIDNYEVYADDQIYTISVLTGNIERGKGVKGAWEWFDMQATEKEIAMISRLMNAERAVIRYIGKNGVFERAVGELEKLRLEYMLQLYRILTREQTLLTSNTGRK